MDFSSKTEEIILKGKTFPVQQECSLGAFILDKLSKYGDNIAQIYSLTGESNTFYDIKKRSIQVAKELQVRGIGLEDVISICSTTTPASVLPLLAGIYTGSAISFLDPSLNKFDIKHLMGITTPKIIFIEESCIKIIEEVIEELNLSTEIVVFGDSNKYATLSQLLTQSDEDIDDFEPVNILNPQDHIVLLMASSGVTGLPKCVSISHNAILFQLQLSLANYPNNLILLNMSSLMWITSILVALTAITIGAIRILTPPFEPEHTLLTIEKYKVKWIIIGVTFFARVVTHPKGRGLDMRCVQMVCISGGKVSGKHLADGKNLFPRALLTTSYGLTETTGNVLKLNFGKPNAVGYLLPDMQAKVIDVDNGTSLGPYKEGELCFRGKLLFSGYYKNEKATLHVIDKHGWFHTGDLAYYDDEECFYIVGRIKEIFICKGWQVSPSELEAVLLEHPEIKEAVVIGIPHQIDVARPKAFIVKLQNSVVTEQEIHLYMKERKSPGKQLTGGIVFVDTLPTTVNGKIRKRDLIQ